MGFLSGGIFVGAVFAWGILSVGLSWCGFFVVDLFYKYMWNNLKIKLSYTCQYKSEIFEKNHVTIS